MSLCCTVLVDPCYLDVTHLQYCMLQCIDIRTNCILHTHVVLWVVLG